MLLYSSLFPPVPSTYRLVPTWGALVGLHADPWAHGVPWGPMGSDGVAVAPHGAHRIPWDPMGTHGTLWDPMGPMGPNETP